MKMTQLEKYVQKVEVIRLTLGTYITIQLFIDVCRFQFMLTCMINGHFVDRIVSCH